MAVTVLTTPTSAQAAPPADPYTTLTHTCTAGSDRLLLLFVGVGESTGPFINASPTYGGQTMTRIGSGSSDSNFVAADVWYLKEAGIAAAGSNIFSIDTTPASGQIDQLGVGAVCLAGVDQTTPVDGVQTSSGTGTTPQVTVTSATDDLTVAMVSTDQNTGPELVPNNTQIFEETGIATDTCHAAQYAAGAASVVLNWTQPSEAYAIIGFNVNAAGTAVPSVDIIRGVAFMRGRRFNRKRRAA